MVVDFLYEILGFPFTGETEYIFYILGGIFSLILLDGIISFVVGAISSLIVRGRD